MMVPQDARGWAGLVGGVVLVIVLIVTGTWLYDMHERVVPPDVRSVAQSTAVQEADAAATNAISAEFTGLLKGADWLVPGPSAVGDYCASQPPDAIGASYSPVVCVRSVTRFYGFDGVFAQRYAALAADLTASGWHGSDPVRVTTSAGLLDTSVGPGGLGLTLSGRSGGAASVARGFFGTADYGTVNLDPGAAGFTRQSVPVNGEDTAKAVLSSHDDYLVLMITCRYYGVPAGDS